MIPTSMTPTEVARLVELARDRDVIELGTYLGHSAVAMAGVARIVHTVDWHRGDPHAGDEDTATAYLDNLTRYGVRDRVVAHVGRFADVLPLLRPGSFDLAFHDAYHETEAVRADIALLLPLLRPGGVLAFHDYGLFGVAAAVDGLGLPIEFTETLAVVRP